jgi:hypothetical protein
MIQSQSKMRLRPLPCALLALAAAILVRTSVAWADDPEAGLAEFEAGRALEEQGRYAEALPHLLESLRLHAELETLAHLAASEEHLLKFVDARTHWVEAEERAALEGNLKLRDAAASELALLEKRTPRLALKLAPGSPSTVEVLRDGTVLGSISPGLPLPTDPGDHTIVVRAKGHADASTHVALAEGEEQQVVLNVGPEVAEPDAPARGASVAPASADPHRLGAQRIVAVAAASAGGASLVLGTIFGVAALTTWGNAEADCSAGCAPNSMPQTERSHALTDATVSTAGFVAGGVLVALGAALWLSAPSSQESARPTGTRGVSGVALVPAWGGLAIVGAF